MIERTLRYENCCAGNCDAKIESGGGVPLLFYRRVDIANPGRRFIRLQTLSIKKDFMEWEIRHD